MNHNKEKGITTMKKKNLTMIATSAVFLLSTLFAKEMTNAGSQHVARDLGGLENQSPAISVMNINNIAQWTMKDGAYTTAGSHNGQQGDYPIFTGGLIYADGMLWGAKVTDHQGTSEVRVGGSTYYHGLKAGRVIYKDGAVAGSDDPVNNHVWRVRKDWSNGDLTTDAANYYGYTAASDVSAEQIATVKGQYEYDWMNWPAAWGAPYDDVDGNGSYDPNTDIPGYPGADQTLWTIANDVPTIVNAAGDSIGWLSTAPGLYGADAIGIELQITMWGYAFGAGDPLGNMIFKKATMKYTGLPDSPADSRMDSLYFTQWSDPDLGTYTDDYVGCDIELSFGYVYNGNRLDGVFNGIHNLPCPAGGYDFLQGPPDTDDIDGDGDTTEYLGMTSFTYFGAGSSISDPDLASYAGSLQFYNLMEGYLPRPEYPVQIPWIDLSTGLETKFALAGDPVAGSGWIDGVQLPPGDRRLVMASGPFTMKLGESADVVIGLLGGMGLDAVSSVSVAKFHDQYAQYAYDQNFSLPSAPSSPSLSGVEMDGAIGIDWGSSASAVSSTEETVSAGFEFEGYVVYQLPSSSSPLSEAVKVATYDKVNLILNILDPTVDPITGLVVDAAKQTGTDGGVQRYFETDYDEIRGRPMSNGIGYHFAVTAYSFLPDNEGSPFKTLESGESRISITPHDANPGVMVYSEMNSDIEVVHDGTANAFVNVNVVNPNELTGDAYEVYFSEQVYELNLDGSWSAVGAARGASKVTDLSTTTVTGAAATSLTVGTIDVSFQINVGSPDYNYADGVQLTFPVGTVINSAAGGPIALISDVNPNVVMFGDNSVSTGGFFSGGEVVVVNINTPSGFPATPIDVDWIVYDDGWAQAWCTGVNVADCANCDTYSIGTGCDGTVYTELVDANGTVSVSELALFVQTEKHWNLGNTTSGAVLLEKQTFVGGADSWNGGSAENKSMLHYNSAAAVTTDGFQVNVDGGYAAPTDVFGHTYDLDADNAALYGESIYDIDSYAQNGWALTAKAVDTYGNGITDVGILQRDIQVRFVGEFRDEPIVSDAGVVYYDGDPNLPGSYAWLSGSRVGSFSDHPDPANDGSGVPIRVWVPFQVWDMEAEGGPMQIDIDLYDRIQSYDAGDTVYVFNPYNRMYTHFIHHAYQEDGVYDGGSSGYPSDFFTWNVVWWDTQFNQGDIVTFNYANPIQVGIDKFTWATQASTTASSNDVSAVSVYPNPYYGTHEIESSRADKYVSFNHLPAEATIDIYSLGGVFVRSLDKTDATSQFAQWDLKNQYGYPVASGMYVARVTSGGEEKILKIALVQETQVLKYY